MQITDQSPAILLTEDSPIVVLSSSLEKADLTSDYRLGANSYGVKPMDFDCDAETVRTLAHYWLKFDQTPGS